ncbi:hypothetical protein H4CHR_02930 [Variovorax sp. PBS-H4]|uniref:hypothetical protein n=1 Tax=Variovorax sp. PBS-H4 TaxID=434008 RepID=UPI001316E424|nr:hypothetical protein [Variovorax sp. PBS-H4]VTU32041.1 hypothetical protein H4CHR_02930 [Variovorax sp. PBS-H4]
MSNHLKQLAQRVIDNYAKDLSALDDDQIDALVELGNEAATIVRLCTPTVPGPDKVEENLAVFSYRLAADSGYSAEATYSGVSAETYGHIVGLLNRSVKVVTPEIEEKLARLEGLDK